MPELGILVPQLGPVVGYEDSPPSVVVEFGKGYGGVREDEGGEGTPVPELGPAVGYDVSPPTVLVEFGYGNGAVKDGGDDDEQSRIDKTAKTDPEKRR